MIQESIFNTNNLSIKRYQERHKFDQKVLIQSVDQDDESDDIFNDARPINKPSVDVNKMLKVEIENENFDITEYLSKNQFDQKHIINQSKYKNKTKRKEKKSYGDTKMLEGEADYYYECYQPVGLSIAEEKDHQAEVEVKKQVDPNFKNYDFIKQDLKKKKKHRQNYQKQLDQIEDVNLINYVDYLKRINELQQYADNNIITSLYINYNNIFILLTYVLYIQFCRFDYLLQNEKITVLYLIEFICKNRN